MADEAKNPGAKPAERLAPADLANLRILHRDDLKTLLEESAAIGGSRALAAVGLHDEEAAKDVRDLREWLKAWRIAKRTAISTAVTTIVRGTLLVLVLGIGAWLLGIKTPWTK